MSKITCFLVVVVVLGLVAAAFADVPHLISYQGKLTDGKGVPITGTRQVTFKLYTEETGISPIWTEIHPGVELTDGLYNVMLGSVASFDRVNFSEPYWLEIAIDGTVMDCRYQLAACPYAMNIPDNAVLTAIMDEDGKFQFSVTKGNPELQIEGRGAASVEFDRDEHKVIINVPAAHSGTKTTANYITKSDGTNCIDTQAPIYETAGGIVGIGTTGPDRKLDVLDSSNPQLRLTHTDGSVYTDFQTTSAGELYINPSGGNVGIGTNDPSDGLEVYQKNIFVDNGGNGFHTGLISSGSILYSAMVFRKDGTRHAGLRWNGSILELKNASVSHVNPDYWTSTSLMTWNVQNMKVGIKTSSPSAIFDCRGDAIFNDGSGDYDFRVEGNGDANLLFTNAGNDRVGIGTNAPTAKLDVRGSAVFNEGSGDYDFRVEGNGDANLLFTDAGNDRVGIGTNSPTAKLDVRGSAIFNEDGGDYDFHIEGNNDDDLFFVDAGIDGVGIGGGPNGTPREKLYVYSHVTGNKNVRALRVNAQGDHEDEDIFSIYAEAGGTADAGVGIYATANTLGGTNIGVYGYADDGTNNYAGYFHRGTDLDYAGYFVGNVNIDGDLDVTGTKNFLMDHPLDPLDKTLRHSCIESPEYLCLYRGKVQLDANGKGKIEMPSYFAALTKEDEATVNLTPVGKPFMTGYDWNSGFTSFSVYGEPNREVSYIVLADRDDPVVRKLARPVEEEKTADIKGKLYQPEAYGYPDSMGVSWEHRPKDE